MSSFSHEKVFLCSCVCAMHFRCSFGPPLNDRLIIEALTNSLLKSDLGSESYQGYVLWGRGGSLHVARGGIPIKGEG